MLDARFIRQNPSVVKDAMKKRGLDDRLVNYIGERKLDLLGIINIDKNIYEMDINGKSIFDIPKESPALKQAVEMVEKLKL